MPPIRGNQAAVICAHCGGVPHASGARFCGYCGASLSSTGAELPAWQRPAAVKYSHVAMPRIALSCPECGEPMRFGFRKVCRRCGAQLVMVPRLFHPYYVKVYVRGPRAALAELTVDSFWVVAVFGLLMLLADVFGH